MIVKIRTKGMRLFLPVPVKFMCLAMRWMPERIMEDIRANIPEPYGGLVTKDHILMVLEECLDVIKESKGLEVIHVETGDGTYLSVKL